MAAIQRAFPIEDADAFEFDDNNLFSVNQLPGYDLVESGPRANVGFIANAIFKGGEIQGLVGQTYRLKPDPIFAGFTGENGTASDVVGRVSIKFPHLDFTDRLDLDRGNGSSGGTNSMSPEPMAVPRCRSPMCNCRPRRSIWACRSREQINAQADINFYQNWQAFAAIERDLLAGQMLDTEYGLGYEDECLAISRGLSPQIYLRRHPGRAALDLGDSAIFPEDRRPAGPAFQPVPAECLRHQPSLDWVWSFDPNLP